MPSLTTLTYITPVSGATFTAPCGLSSAVVELWGAGGGGSSSNTTNNGGRK
jgi:hypothetical protein